MAMEVTDSPMGRERVQRFSEFQESWNRQVSWEGKSEEEEEAGQAKTAASSPANVK